MFLPAHDLDGVLERLALLARRSRLINLKFKINK